MKSILSIACVAVLTIGAMTAKQRAGWGYVKVGH